MEAMMGDSELERVVRARLAGDEELRAAVSAYTGAGLSRVVVGVTDRRVLAIKSTYWSIRDKGLLWADPLDEVALADLPQEVRMKGAYTGNTYIRIRRADGSKLRLNPRSGFAGDHAGTRSSVERLYSLISGRF
ncbi:hypothetical protein LHJ74_26540 [Streptomyces sp. N2-109]|uniref:YokE-like PH domain-containing protein n=1 Tax=Streptomyces gossypii TaxID=2883101 RepID=A0ABT2JZV2_9ACTN|nr:hypothetical protein [Streptomyces gossypii]MCT2593423.1 hypothetical protein [Streptomyces gossypii]